MSACDSVRAQGDNNETARWSGSSMLAPRADFDYFTGCEGTRAFPVFIVGRAHACPVQSVSRSERAERRVQPRRDARPNKFPELFGGKILETLELRGSSAAPRFRLGAARDYFGTTAEFAASEGCALDSVVKDLSCRGSEIIFEITYAYICYRK